MDIVGTVCEGVVEVVFGYAVVVGRVHWSVVDWVALVMGRAAAAAVAVVAETPSPEQHER
jgi:hypothetical protein